ncbi:SulP family inorganic anion transporter [Fischerella thermalis]|jgi:SulP family sulfate permease|uniref:Sulfate transporter n=3 Tax=Fischerella TaxID=1190 RepID=G6FMK7_9CYAN|nr:solute carrier family 26 protein [Fischerella thermalis]PMB10342.1 sodium-independent anion transporter [Fischerella thermalis CCMEE 5328]EHC19287.1 sulfate transporter [Fischerella thermalis JSC-11]PLZ05239.1 sodium-independent anion transporter [Fischerella thermalis WC114]PLZ16041.1 sodium-independent anion transporter [Fischerella thermalis WC1110]PLZ17688.1 sodium-independent anion transporter [Fischerella thermalis WC157]
MLEHNTQKQRSPQQTRLHRLSHYLPILDWGLHYRREYLAGDLSAGIIVASLLIPQGMAYALLASLPPQVGLYASILPQIIYAFLGTSRFISVAPVAVDSLMVAAAVGSLAAENTPEYLGLALLLALMVGLIEILMGVLRLGFLVNFLSQAVISGFISAAAIIIGFSQVKHLLGLKIPQTESFIRLLTYIAQEIAAINWVTFTLGFVSILVLVYFHQKLGKQLQKQGFTEQTITPVTKSAPLLLVIGTSLLVWLLRLDQFAGVKIVGEIPKGLPSVTIPSIDFNHMQALLPAAFAISFVGFMEAFAVGKFLASKRRQKVDANQELIALGAANLSAALSGGYPVTGGLSRSVVNFSANANTPLASMITALMIALTVMLLTPLFYFLPQTCLAAIILVAVSNLLDFGTLKRLWAYNRADAIAWLTSFVAVLATSVEKGILVGAAMSILLHLWRTSRPHIAIVGRVGETEHFRNVLRHNVKTCPHVLAVRVDASLYFVNTKYLEDYLLKAVTDHPEVKHLVLVCSAVNFIDGSALETFKDLIVDFKNRGIEFYMSEVKGPVMDQLAKVGFVDELGRDHIFLTTDQAMQALKCV